MNERLLDSCDSAGNGITIITTKFKYLQVF